MRNKYPLKSCYIIKHLLLLYINFALENPSFVVILHFTCVSTAYQYKKSYKKHDQQIIQFQLYYKIQF